jgi:hypothetical protein
MSPKKQDAFAIVSFLLDNGDEIFMQRGALLKGKVIAEGTVCSLKQDSSFSRHFMPDLSVPPASFRKGKLAEEESR